MKYSRIFAVLTVMYVTWACVFIWRTSTHGLDGHRYFAIFDDGMISMRYAKHVAQGLGPVWNVGEHVEGYTNPLWVVVMAISVELSGPHLAPLAIQLFGLILVIVSAYLVRQSAYLISSASLPAGSADLAGFLAGSLVYAYYPISFWALDGMEVSALTVLVAGSLRLTAAQAAGKPGHALPMLLITALVAYFLRPDGFLQLVPMIVLSGLWTIRSRETSNLRWSAAIAVLAITSVAAHLAWRWSYYGLMLPNTYTLKMEGYDLTTRLHNGVAFVAPYVLQTYPWLIAAASFCFVAMRASRSLVLFLAAVPMIATGYQVYVGGDPFLVWRQLTPAFCAIATLAGCAAAAILSTDWHRAASDFRIRAGAVAIGSLIFVLCVDASFIGQLVGQRIYNVQRTHDQVRRALAWSEIARGGATALLFNAGTLPYFWDGMVYDALGKMDRKIANREPDMAVSWDGMKGVPGHAKFDLGYSLVELKPDYIEKWAWFSQDMTRYVVDNYVAVKPTASEVALCVRKDSRYIDWSKVELLGDCPSNATRAL